MKRSRNRVALIAATGLVFGAVTPASAQGIADVTSAGSVNEIAAQGYILRSGLMLADDNPRGSIDQLNEALRLCPSSSEAERAKIAGALAAMSVPGNDAVERLNAFLEEYPASPWRERALLAVADVLYDQGEYAYALRAYRRVSFKALDAASGNAGMYRKGYCLLKLADYDRALPIYDYLSRQDGYEGNARFYQGYIAYAKGDYDRAEELMRSVPQNETPGNMAPYYLAQMSFLRAEYKESLAQARALLSRGSTEREFIAEAERLAGESLFRLGNEKEATGHLERYVAMAQAPLNSALYLLGVDRYRSARYDEAVKLFTTVSAEDSKTGHSACLYLGQCYLKLDNLNAATMAFERAIRMAHDSEVQETAFYNLAVARMEGGNVPFGSAVGMLEDFLERYPDSRYAPSVAGHVINGYLIDRNYLAALNAIERIQNPSAEVLAAKQRVLYLLGARELKGGEVKNALFHLREASRLEQYDRSVAAEVMLWLAEAQSKNGDYEGAVHNYNNYLRCGVGNRQNMLMARYGLGYAQFARKEFAGARKEFSRFITDAPASTDKHLIADAYNRLADSQYYTSDFNAAAENYGHAYEANPASGDYPVYQQGLMKGLRRDYKGKIETLSEMITLFPASALVPSALLEIAESYGETGQNDRAIETYTMLVSRYPSTSQGRKGQLLLAITYLNAGNRSQAMAHYKRVITKYPSSEEALVATDDLKQLYADMGRVGDYVSFINGVADAPKPESAEIAEMTMQSARVARERGNDTDALAHATEVIEKYPDSSQAVEALALKAEVEYQRGDSESALATYTALEKCASTAADINAARIGVMRTCRDMGDNVRVVETANSLLSSSSLGSAGKKEVAYTKAVALAGLGRMDEATEIWESLSEDIHDIYGTKSVFNLAEHYAENKQDAKAIKTVNKLIEANPPHDYWIARGFILLSDLLRRKGSSFEADEYLKSLRENYPGNEADIFKMIDERLK